MRFKLSLLLLVVCVCSTVRAQKVIPIVSGNANIDFSQVSGTSFKINVLAPITVNIVNQPTSSPIVITVLFSQDGTGHTVTFGSSFNAGAAPSIPTTASSNTSVSFQFDGNSNSWYTVTPAGASGTGVTLVNTSAPITGGPINSTGTIGLTVGQSCAPGLFQTGADFLLNSVCGSVPPSGGGTPPYVGPTAVNGCGVEWTGLLTFTVGQCTYIINGTTYNSQITNLTLAAADVTNPRIDDIIVDNTGIASVLTGTPAASPAAPAVDPSTQLLLTFVTVAANATTPTGITSATIYDENVEWTTAKGGTNSARVTLNSTNNPYRGTVDIEYGAGGTIATTTYAQATKPAAGTENLTTWNSLIFYIRNKAAWPAARSATIQWYNGSTPVGVGIVLNNNNFGFNATTNFTGYQQIIIPTSYFQTGSAAVTTVRFTVSGTGAALTGFYLDAISLQAGINPTPPLPTTLMNWRGTYSAAVNYLPNDTVTVNGCYYVALASNLNVPVTTTATWAGTGSCATAKTGQVLTAVNGSPSVYATPGIADGNGGAAVTTTPYLLKCDSSTAVLDGAHLIRFQSGAAAVTVPLSTATGCTGNNMAFTLVDDGAGTLTVSRTSADTFTVVDGVSNTDGATSFTLGNGGYATVSQGAAGIWEVRKVNAVGTGSVMSVVIAGTANQILASGTCTITTTGTCTLSAITPFLLGTDNSVAGVLGLSNSAANAHTNWGSGATTTNTINGFATVPTTGHLIDCTVSSTTCLLHDSAVVTANVVNASSPGVGLCHFAGSTQTCTSSAVVGSDMTNATVTATQLAAQYSKGSCTEAWGGSGTSFAMTSGDDAIVNNACYNDSGVTRTITALKCRSDNAGNTTVLTPTFGSAGTGTAILTGTVTCGNSYAYSATGTLNNTAWTTGTGIDPGMSTVGNATSIAMIVEYTF